MAASRAGSSAITVVIVLGCLSSTRSLMRTPIGSGGSGATPACSAAFLAQRTSLAGAAISRGPIALGSLRAHRVRDRPADNARCDARGRANPIHRCLLSEGRPDAHEDAQG